MIEQFEGGFTISTDPTRLDLDVIHGYLARSYWAEGISREQVEKRLRHALCFGLYEDRTQIGFARVITDYASFAYLCDVFVLESHQGKGLGKRLMESVLAHPELQSLRTILLATRDAHGLYARFGFKTPDNPNRLMQIHHPDFYKSPSP